jgi:DNA-nicking Smr family endonuclease
VAKKKTLHINPPKPKEFHVTPFGNLKGISVAETAPTPQVKPIVQKTADSIESGLDLFLQAVAGVQPLQSSGKKQPKAGVNPFLQAAKRVEEKFLVIDENVFLEEIGRLKIDSKFSDNVPNEDELQPLAGNRLRQIKRGVVSVNHQLDLHGLSRDEALEALKRFLHSAQKKGQKAVLVITGKGNHSSEEPVLQQAVASWLRDAGRTTVLEFAPAPREMGGSGAYVVFLRQIPPPA